MIQNVNNFVLSTCLKGIGCEIIDRGICCRTTQQSFLYPSGLAAELGDYCEKRPQWTISKTLFFCCWANKNPLNCHRASGVQTCMHDKWGRLLCFVIKKSLAVRASQPNCNLLMQKSKRDGWMEGRKEGRQDKCKKKSCKKISLNFMFSTEGGVFFVIRNLQRFSFPNIWLWLGHKKLQCWISGLKWKSFADIFLEFNFLPLPLITGKKIRKRKKKWREVDCL